MELVLFGPPGAGKGTQATRIAETWHIPHISTGDLFRENIRDDTPLGRKAKSYVTRGELVPNEIVVEMALDRLSREDCTGGFLLDGFPRDVEQAGSLDQWLSERGRRLTAVLCIDLDDETIIDRLVSRRVCSSCGATYNLRSDPPRADGTCRRCGGSVVQRPDDTRETVERRLKVYKEQTAPIEGFYRDRGVLVRISGDGDAETVFLRIKERLDGLRE